MWGWEGCGWWERGAMTSSYSFYDVTPILTLDLIFMEPISLFLKSGEIFRLGHGDKAALLFIFPYFNKEKRYFRRRASFT